MILVFRRIWSSDFYIYVISISFDKVWYLFMSHPKLTRYFWQTVQSRLRLRRRGKRFILFRHFQVEGSIYDLSLSSRNEMLERAKGIGVSNMFDRTGWRVSGTTFRPLGILSHTRGNSATNPWWPPADKYTAVKRYDILSLRELRRGSRGNVRVRHEESVSTKRYSEKSSHHVSHVVYLLLSDEKYLQGV